MDSLETFTEVLSLVSAGLRELLSGGQSDELNFGADSLENGLAVVRIVSILIFTVHNVNKESEGQTYAEIVQRAVLLQNAFTAAFELMGYIVERCAQLSEPSSSYILPGILVFVEWLASNPDFAAGSDADENQTMVRSKFWNHCISFLNKLLSVGPLSVEDDEENTCFNNMSRYEEGETENRLALWEDFELRGFLPLLPAQTILDFSRKQSLGSEGDKERKARVKRIVSAGKALANVVRVNQNVIYFDLKGKKFVIGVEPPTVDDFISSTYLDMPNTEELMQENPADKTKAGLVLSNQHQYVEGDEDDEVIVFKPMSEKPAEVVTSTWIAPEGLEPDQKASGGDNKLHANTISSSLNNFSHRNVFDANLNMPVSINGVMPQHLQTVQPHASRWLEEISLANSLNGLTFLENGHAMKPNLQEAAFISNHGSLAPTQQQSVSAGATDLFHGLSKFPESVLPSKVHAVAATVISNDNMAVNTSTVQAGLSKAVSRPTRHIGPPPGFSAHPFNQANRNNISDPVSGNAMMDNYSWLDGYQFPSSTKGLGSNGLLTYSHPNSQQVINNNGMGGTVSFPFPGKQVPPVPPHIEKQNGWQDNQSLELAKIHHNQQLQQQQQFTAGNQQFTPLPEQFQGPLTGRYFV